MSQIIYTIHFEGELSPIGTSPNVMKATLVAKCIRMTVVGPNGLQTPLEPALSEQASCESDVTFLGGFESPEGTSAGEAGFKETGLITFGGGEHQLRFSRQGAVMWQVDSGEGRFKDAQGLITSNFMISDAGEVIDHHMGVIFVA